MNFIRREWRLFIVVVCIIANVFIWYAVKREMPSPYLTMTFLNIGQGDAIYIESPVHNQVMIDGGPSRKVLSELEGVMPFYDKSINMLVVTNPDADHYSGFIDILNMYSVGRVMEPGTKASSERYAEFEKIIADKKIPDTVARRGQIIHLGGGADIKILFPDRDVSKASTNEGSIIAELTYGSTSVMLTGDAPVSTENYEASLDGANIRSDIIKIGHHGSKTSASELFLETVNPKYAIISAGLNNRYGHPHKETLDLLQKLHIPYFITYERGGVTAVSDGESFTIKTEK